MIADDDTVNWSLDSPRHARRPDPASIQAAPKVLLHDHLDGGLRPETLVELADIAGYKGLPAQDPEKMRRRLESDAASASLAGYLGTFAHTVAVLQSADALERCAREAVVDLALDGVVYAELRFAPELHGDNVLRPADAVEAVLAGLRVGESDASSGGHPITANLILSAIRSNHRSLETAQLAVDYRDRGVVGFDLAGLEEGFPPSEHLEAIELVHRAGVPVTLHAGEGFGLPSIRDAVFACGAERIGHGVRIVEDIWQSPTGEMNLGAVARRVRDEGVVLEMCPSSNLHTGVVESIGTHPITMLDSLDFRVTLNTDNRLMSDTSLSREFELLTETFGCGLDSLERWTLNAAESAFLSPDERRRLVRDAIEPWYRTARGNSGGQVP